MATAKSYINLSNKFNRVVLLVDMDCFYCQIEEKLDPNLKGKPIAVVQYNAWKGGGIIAVNYAARAQGVTRHMRGDEAKELCPDIVLVKVPSFREKADLTKYRDAGKEVACVLQEFTSRLERASVDEAYLDITEEVVKRFERMDKGSFALTPTELENTYAIGYDYFGHYVQEMLKRIENGDADFDCEEDDIPAVLKSDIKLLIGASIANEIRAMVKEKTGYECSAGIAHNKILAKLACGMNKPNKQTILPIRQITSFFSFLPISKIKGLGGKFGEELCEFLKIKFVGDLLLFSEKDLQKRFDEKNGSWLYLIARGIDLESITPRFYAKSIGCCKKFPGMNAITGIQTLKHWFNELAAEICERIEKDVVENNRRASKMVVSYIQEINGNDVSSSRSIPLVVYDPENIAKSAFEVIQKNTDEFLKTGSMGPLNNSIKFLGISVGNFKTIQTNKYTIDKLFLNHSKKKDDIERVDVQAVEASGDIVSGEESTNKKSFFKNYFNKALTNDTTTKSITSERNGLQLESVDLKANELASDTINQKPIELKSFFLNAMSRESSEKATNNANTVSTPTIQTQSKDDDVVRESIEDPNNSFTKPSSSTYVHTYAEFLVPEAKDQDFIKCDKCGKKVLSYEIQAHNDFHFALELSQEQRVQFRAELETKTTVHSSKRLKISATNRSGDIQKTLKPINAISIKKFLVNSSANSEDNDEEKDKCMECGAMVIVTKLPEHLDYHAAKKLHIELNSSMAVTSTTLGSLNSSCSSAAKKNNESKSNSKLQAVKSKPITAFFEPEPFND